MAREARTHPPEEESGGASESKPDPDPVGRLDDVLAILEEMLDHRRVPLTPPSPGGESPEVSGGAAPVRPAADPCGPGNPEDPDALPLLRDVVAPAADGDAGGAGGESEAAGQEEDDPETALDRELLPFGFEIIPDDPLPRIGDLDPFHPPDPGPGDERYGDAPPPSLDPKVYRHLIERVANEIDVIVQTGAEEAMRRAAADIAARVREHVAIILPEVIEELVRMSSRPRD